MYFYEVLEKCDKDKLTEAFLTLCSDASDIKAVREKFKAAMADIEKLTPVIDDDMTVRIDKTEYDGEEYEAVHGVSKSEGTAYGLIIAPWAEVLGYRTDEDNVADYGREAFAAAVLWELTYLGFDEQTISSHVKEWESGE